MILAMIVGMMVGGAILALAFATILEPAIRGMTRTEVLNGYPVLICLVMAASMTLPMVAWMRRRGHEWRICTEMAAWMAVPLVPIFGLLWLGIIPGTAACGLYCASMVPAMIVAMLLRLDDYTMDHANHARHPAHVA
jgi:hypothetical protein